MEKYRLLIGIAVLAAIIAGASYAYRKLSEGYSPDTIAVLPSSVPTTHAIQPENTQPDEAQEEEEEEEAQKEESQADEGQADDAATDEANTAIPAPDFTITDINGEEVKFSDFIGKPIILNFWASWCPPCKAELPDFENVFVEVHEDITFLMVDLVDGQRETVEKGSAYIEENGYTFPVYYDTLQEAAYVYGISAIPTTLFIDKDGNVIAGHEGQLNEAMLRKGVSLIYPQGDEITD